VEVIIILILTKRSRFDLPPCLLRPDMLVVGKSAAEACLENSQIGCPLCSKRLFIVIIIISNPSHPIIFIYYTIHAPTIGW